LELLLLAFINTSSENDLHSGSFTRNIESCTWDRASIMASKENIWY